MLVPRLIPAVETAYGTSRSPPSRTAAPGTGAKPCHPEAQAPLTPPLHRHLAGRRIQPGPPLSLGAAAARSPETRSPGGGAPPARANEIRCKNHTMSTFVDYTFSCVRCPCARPCPGARKAFSTALVKPRAGRDSGPSRGLPLFEPRVHPPPQDGAPLLHPPYPANAPCLSYPESRTPSCSTTTCETNATAPTISSQRASFICRTPTSSSMSSGR
jgi:hypothetical protein